MDQVVCGSLPPNVTAMEVIRCSPDAVVAEQTGNVSTIEYPVFHSIPFRCVCFPIGDSHQNIHIYHPAVIHTDVNSVMDMSAC
jgi:hypothetical protein